MPQITYPMLLDRKAIGQLANDRLNPSARLGHVAAQRSLEVNTLSLPRLYRAAQSDKLIT